MNSPAIVQKLWNYCKVLRDDLSACVHAQAGGMSYGDYPGSSPGQANSEAAPVRPAPATFELPCSAQWTYLLFLKMADEPACTYRCAGKRTRQLLLRCSTSRHPWRSQAPYLSPNGDNQKSPVPDKYDWTSLIKKDGDELFDHYRHTLEALGLLAGR